MDFAQKIRAYKYMNFPHFKDNCTTHKNTQVQSTSNTAPSSGNFTYISGGQCTGWSIQPAVLYLSGCFGAKKVRQILLIRYIYELGTSCAIVELT